MQTNKGTHFVPSKLDINLEKYIARSKKRLQAILKRLQWSEELLLQNCNNKSRTAVTLLPDEAEPPLPASFSTNNTVVIVEDALRAIVADPKAEIPQTFSDLQCNFSREQKLQIYEYVVQNTEKLLEPELTVPINDESQQSMTFAEIVAIKKREKNQKRRKYRTSKPTHIEEVRNLVELQMQALKQYLNPEEVTPPRLCHRERDLLKLQNELRGHSTSNDKQRKSATKKDVSDKDNGKKSKSIAYRTRSPSIHKKLERVDKRKISGDREHDYSRRSRSHRDSASKERTHRKSIKQRSHRSSHRSRSRDRRHRSRSEERRHKSQSRSKDSRKHKSRSRSKERRYRSRSKERRHKSRSKETIHKSRNRSKERRRRSQSKERKHKNRSRSKERSHTSRGRSRSKSRKRSHEQRDYRRRRSSSNEKREGRRKEHYHKRSDYEVEKSNVDKGRCKVYKYIPNSKHDEHKNNGNTKNHDKSLTEGEYRTKEKTSSCKDHSRGRDSSSDSNKTDETNTSEDIKLEPVINDGFSSHYIKLEVKLSPDSKHQEEM